MMKLIMFICPHGCMRAGNRAYIQATLLLVSSSPVLYTRTTPDPFMGAEYQTSTHFQFGNHKKPSASIYSSGMLISCHCSLPRPQGREREPFCGLGMRLTDSYQLPAYVTAFVKVLPTSSCKSENRVIQSNSRRI